MTAAAAFASALALGLAPPAAAPAPAAPGGLTAAELSRVGCARRRGPARRWSSPCATARDAPPAW